MERRLAAILAADIVGYSRLMSDDESGILSAIKLLRTELIEPKARQYHGRIVKLMGDGALMEFPSAVEAVAFATEVQCAMADRNAEILEDRQIIYRIGINVGDIIIEDGDIFGDGVIIAARLEGLAEPGGICVARNIVNQVKGKLDLTFELVGERRVKNISQPVTVHRVVLDKKAAALATPIVHGQDDLRKKKWPAAAALAIAALIPLGGAFWWIAGTPQTEPESREQAITPTETKPTVAVLPFNNLSDDRSQEYFSDGITEDLITDLSKVSGLYVIARNSTFVYKGASHDVRKVGRELNARYVMEGSIRRSGGRIRINAQLVDAQTGNHLWADRYDRDGKDLFALQDEVLAKIVKALRVKLTPNEERRLAQHETENPQAYDLYLQGLQQESFFTREGNLESRRLFEQAIALDAQFADAYGHLAQAYIIAQDNGWLADRAAAARKALELAEKAIELDHESPHAHWSLARIVTRQPISDPQRALVLLQRTVELDPNYADGHAFLANVLNYVGRPEEALGTINTAIRMNPRYPFWYPHVKGQALFLMGQYDGAIPSFQIAIERNPTVVWPHQWLLATYGHLGKSDEAEWEISELEAIGQPPTIKSLRERWIILHPEYRDRFVEGLRKAGVPEE